MTLSNAGAPDDTMVALVVLFIAAVLLVRPSFALLFSLQSRRLLGAGQPSPSERSGPVTRAAVLGTIAIATVIRWRRYR